MKFGNEIKLLNFEDEIQIKKIVRIRNVEFDEEFLSDLLSHYFAKKLNGEFPKLQDALKYI